MLKRFLKNFMNGRNGIDELGVSIDFCAFILLFTSAVIKNIFLFLISAVGVGYSAFRFFSYDTKKRKRENLLYIYKTELLIFRLEQRKEYKIYTCKKCGRNIRIPKNQRKKEVECPLCGEKIYIRSLRIISKWE